jgi:hypothetical protein
MVMFQIETVPTAEVFSRLLGNASHGEIRREK